MNPTRSLTLQFDKKGKSETKKHFLIAHQSLPHTKSLKYKNPMKSEDLRSMKKQHQQSQMEVSCFNKKENTRIEIL
jgi:hypothetical protein